jgi:hypothetical protein
MIKCLLQKLVSMELELQTTDADIEATGDVFETKLPERKMFLQLPDERPLLRRSTSPSIVLSGEDDCKISPARSTSDLPSPDQSRKPSSSRKSSIVSFFFQAKVPSRPQKRQQRMSQNKENFSVLLVSLILQVL